MWYVEQVSCQAYVASGVGRQRIEGMEKGGRGEGLPASWHVPASEWMATKKERTCTPPPRAISGSEVQYSTVDTVIARCTRLDDTRRDEKEDKKGRD